jgi:hypothetical protein
MTIEQNKDHGIHPFEQAGLGQAPFRCTGLSENLYSAAPGHVQPGGTCAYCGQGIRYECNILSHDGQRFTVGMDCVWKLSHRDNRLTSEVKREKAKRDREAREAKRLARVKARQEAIEAELDRQRSVNGGLTDRELAAKVAQEAIEAGRAEWTAKNEWLIDVLWVQPGDFCRAMCERLEVGPVGGLPERAIAIIRDIYCKSKGRRGSKGYDEAAEDFDRRLASGG